MKTLTTDQANALRTIRDVISEEGTDMSILTGYAGTGKTTLMTEVINVAQEQGFEVRCLAPTNTAAANLTRRTGHECSTIHKAIFIHDEEDERVVYHRRDVDPSNRVLYVVDEASMVSNRTPQPGENFMEPGPLLGELIRHGREYSEIPKFLFVGDPMQLPPVGERRPSALFQDALGMHWPDTRVQKAELTTVMRQPGGSPILDYSGQCIQAIRSRQEYEKRQALGLGMPRLHAHKVACEVAEINAGLSEIEAAIIAFSNREVQHMNQEVRARMGREWGALAKGDHLTLSQPCIIDGDILLKGSRIFIVDCESEIEEWGGCKFQMASFITEGSERVLSAKFNISVLLSLKGLMTPDQERNLKHEAMRTNPRYRNTPSAHLDQYMGALRTRFAYATTCHKAQGQQFNHVFITPAWGAGDPSEKWQWMYTAITRATESVTAFNLYLN